MSNWDKGNLSKNNNQQPKTTKPPRVCEIPAQRQVRVRIVRIVKKRVSESKSFVLPKFYHFIISSL